MCVTRWWSCVLGHYRKVMVGTWWYWVTMRWYLMILGQQGADRWVEDGGGRQRSLEALSTGPWRWKSWILHEFSETKTETCFWRPNRRFFSETKFSETETLPKLAKVSNPRSFETEMSISDVDKYVHLGQDFLDLWGSCWYFYHQLREADMREKCSFFSCPGQLNNWHCLSLGPLVPWSEPTNNQSLGSIKEWP